MFDFNRIIILLFFLISCLSFLTNLSKKLKTETLNFPKLFYYYYIIIIKIPNRCYFLLENEAVYIDLSTLSYRILGWNQKKISSFAQNLKYLCNK